MLMQDEYGQRVVGKMDKEEMFGTIETVYNREISQQKQWLQKYIEEERPVNREQKDGTPVPYQHRFFHDTSFVRNVRESLADIANKERQLEILLSMKEQGNE